MTIGMRNAAYAPVFTGRNFKKMQLRAEPRHPTSLDDRFVPLDHFEQKVLHAQKERIETFLALPDGWNQGRGVPTTEAAVSEAIRFLHDALTHSNVVADASPLDSGGILLEWTFGDSELQVEIEANGIAEYSISVGDDIVEEGPLHLVGPRIRQLREALLARAQ